MIKDYEEKKTKLLVEQNGKCFHCKKTFSSRSGVQLAHRLIKSKANIKLFGLEIIDHVLNLRATHGGACNDAVIINRATKPVEANALIEEIKNSIIEEAQES